MPAKCPNCLQMLSRESSGDYPAKCPTCGVRIKSKSKMPAEIAAAPKPTAPAAEERVVRSFSAKRRGEPTPLEVPVAPPAVETIAEREPENPFDRGLAPTVVEPEPPTVLSMTPAPAPAFAPPAAAAPFAAAPPPSPFEENPFGGTATSAPPKKTSASGIVKWSIIGVLGAGMAGFGGWVVYKQRNELPKQLARNGFQNPDRGYVFYALDGSWQEDKGRAARAGFDLAFHRKDLNAWVTIRTMEPQEDWDLKTATEEAGKLWPDRLKDFSAGPLLKSKLAGREAMAVKGEGTLDGVKTQGITYCIVRDGLVYWLGFESPSEYYSLLEGEFAKARQNFELTGTSGDGKRDIGSETVVTFASKKFPYRLSGTGKQWREVPDLQTDSRFDDVKLVDRTRAAEVTVTARETNDMPAMRVRYVESRKRLYDDKIRELENAAESLEIKGRKALRTLLIASTSGGDFLLFTTFVKGDGLVFQIQCRAPVDKRDVFEPLFAKLVETFEVLDKAPEPPKKESTEAAPSKVADAPMTETKMEPKKPVEKAAPPMEKKPSDEKSAPKEEKKPEPKTEPKKEEKKTETPTKKKKSLDDLD